MRTQRSRTRLMVDLRRLLRSKRTSLLEMRLNRICGVVRGGRPVRHAITDRQARRILARFKRAERAYARPDDMPESVTDVKTGEVVVDKLALTSAVCRASFYRFVRELWSKVVPEAPVWNWHIEYLCNEMQALAERVFDNRPRENDVVVNIPPGTTKSTIISIMFNAWVWTRMPSARFIGASHTEALSQDMSFKTRDLVMSDRYRELFPEVQIRADQNTKTFFQLTWGGWRYAVGVGGSVIGKHAHFIVIDDPIDPTKVKSQTELAEINFWCEETIPTRKVDKLVTVTVLVMQRLHEEDPAAMMLKRNKVKHVCIPAELTDDVKPADLRKFYRDGLMDPVRLSDEALQEYRERGEFFYASQFLQTPMAKSGNMFKVDRVKAGPPPTVFLSIVRYWDKAGTKDGGTWTVGTKMGKDVLGRFWVLDVKRFRLDSFEREQVIRTTAELDGYGVVVVVEQEGGSGGKESAQGTCRSLAGFRVTVDKVSVQTGGKVQRADPWSVQVNAGNVYVPEHAEWVAAWKLEHKLFPASKFKDQVDSASGAFNHVHKPKRRIGAMRSRSDYVKASKERGVGNSYGNV